MVTQDTFVDRANRVCAELGSLFLEAMPREQTYEESKTKFPLIFNSIKVMMDAAGCKAMKLPLGTIENGINKAIKSVDNKPDSHTITGSLMDASDKGPLQFIRVFNGYVMEIDVASEMMYGTPNGSIRKLVDKLLANKLTEKLASNHSTTPPADSPPPDSSPIATPPNPEPMARILADLESALRHSMQKTFPPQTS